MDCKQKRLGVLNHLLSFSPGLTILMESGITMETKDLTGRLEGLEEATTAKGDPYLKLKVDGRSYNYFQPYDNKDKGHIDETKTGLKLFVDEEISFRYEEKDAPGMDHPYKNIKKFLVDFKTAKAPAKKPVKSEESKVAEGKEEAIAKAHEQEAKAKLDAHRQKRIKHMTECLEDAKKTWSSWRYGEDYSDWDMSKDSDSKVDCENIRAIAISFMIEDNRRGL